jgi:FkbM family methyltransferase
VKSFLSGLFSNNKQNINLAYTRSYSQSGEDVIIKFIFDCIGIKNPTYIDIGANHPYMLNNTILFYLAGSRGINIEPNPELFKLLNKNRGKDTNLNIGIAQEKGFLDFYLMSSSTMSTFSRAESEKLQKETSIKLNKVVKTDTDSLPNIINQYAHGIFPDFLSLDVEGFEEVILQSIDYEKNSPKVICIETLSYTENNTELKDQHMIDFLLEKGYRLFADTYINSILVKDDIWKNRKR